MYTLEAEISMKKAPLTITRCRENNLKDISIEIPHDALTVVTGLSGAGKSSLAFDTVYAEGQRRYIETFSPYVRQFFDKVKRPDVDAIEHVRPSIAIQQRTRILSSRSTVGSLTDLNDYLKVLWSNLGEPVCPTCHKPLRRSNPEDAALHIERLLTEESHPHILVCAPITLPTEGARKARNAQLKDEIDRLRVFGYSRLLAPESGELILLDDLPEKEAPRMAALEKLVDTRGRLFVVLDRVRSPFVKASVLDTTTQAFTLGRGSCVLAHAPSSGSEGYTLVELHEFFSCEQGAVIVPPPRPGLFSYNHPLGACTECKGFGNILALDLRKIIPNEDRTLREGALQCWTTPSTTWEQKSLVRFCEKHTISRDIPWRQIPAADRELILHHKEKDFYGIYPWFGWFEKRLYKMHVRMMLNRYRSEFTCKACQGQRLKPSGLSYRIDGLTIADCWQLPVSSLREWITKTARDHAPEGELPRELRDVVSNLLHRLSYLEALGLDYLTLDRQAKTLSGGETQRVNLVTALGSGLMSTQFVLDEPSVGLHPRDTKRLIQAMRDLTQRGNSLLVVEHDPECISAADHIVEIGPGAGAAGGNVVFAGGAEIWPGVEPPPRHSRPAPRVTDKTLCVRRARLRNLKDLSFDIPLQQFVCLTGVSGSGKSTIVEEIIQKRFAEREAGIQPESNDNCVEGFEHVDQVLLVDQTPLAKSPRANIGTYTGVWDYVRDAFAKTEAAKRLGLTRSAFSFNVDGGRCPACKGAGFVREDMQFLSDVYIPCDVCLGKRFQPAVLQVTINGLSAAEILEMTLPEAALALQAQPLRTTARYLEQLGLEHLRIGHPLSELSGGEAQRLKLIPFIQESTDRPSLLIFDEPTTGLHVHDVARLIHLFETLLAEGHSLLCVEHNLQVIAAADWMIDLGPEGGAGGGAILFEGTPAEGARSGSGHTAEHLRAYLDLAPGTSTRPRRGTGRVRRLAATERSSPPSIDIRGAREHNLKNLSLSVPLDTFVVFTGVSGSGKSTIAKDIIYAEGQHRYLECLSPYARQFIQELRRPEIDAITNVKPSICVHQHTFQPGLLSTVGTLSEVYHFLRLLFAKCATQFCPEHPEQAIEPLAPAAMAAHVKGLPHSSVRLLAPIIKMKKGTHREILERAIAAEITEVRVDGVFGSPGSFLGKLKRNQAHTIEYAIARFSPRTVPADLLRDAISQGLSLSGGTLLVIWNEGESVLSVERSCPLCQQGFFKPDPEDLSFHSKRGACSTCSGTGHGGKGTPCPVCLGSRLQPIGRNLRIGGETIADIAGVTSSALLQKLRTLPLTAHQRTMADPILREVETKLETLTALGLGYLALSRDCHTLSGGELQRLRLAAAMGSPLTGALYIFDEPSVGLHPDDNERVLQELTALHARGNSVMMIEHDTRSILAADYVIDVGPGGGRDGGRVVFQGSREAFLASESLTAGLIRDEMSGVAMDTLRASRSSTTSLPKPQLTIDEARCHNVQALDCKLPLQSIVAIAGVSGAGKSSLLFGVIAQTIMDGERKGNSWHSDHGTLKSPISIDRVTYVDQKPIGKNSRSTPASYLGIWDEIRTLFANSLEAKARGWKSSYFSYNTGKGRCPTCSGLGERTLEMNFLPDASVICESCNGRRFRDELETVRYRDLTISQALHLTLEEARGIFVHHRKIHALLHEACELGLGYLTLGQSSATLSGGESQRIKLVVELTSGQRGHTLYLLDEPTTGLHKSDVARLMKSLRALVQRGHSVMLIEHDPDILLASDVIVEMGPGPGAAGGKIVFLGEPAELATAQTAWGNRLRMPLRRQGQVMNLG